MRPAPGESAAAAKVGQTKMVGIGSECSSAAIEADSHSDGWLHCVAHLCCVPPADDDLAAVTRRIQLPRNTVGRMTRDFIELTVQQRPRPTNGAAKTFPLANARQAIVDGFESTTVTAAEAMAGAGCRAAYQSFLRRKNFIAVRAAEPPPGRNEGFPDGLPVLIRRDLWAMRALHDRMAGLPPPFPYNRRPTLGDRSASADLTTGGNIAAEARGSKSA